MKTIFISYSRKDSYTVLPFVDRLEAETSVKCWIDRIGIESGDQFVDKIVNAIDQADVVLFMLSDNSIASEYSKKEVLYAENSGKKVIPVILDKGSLRGWFLFNFGNTDFIMMNDEEHVRKLFSNLRGWFGQEDRVEGSEILQTKNPLIRKALSNISGGNESFEYVFRDHCFSVEISPLVNFVLHFTNCPNEAESLKNTIEVLENYDEQVFSDNLGKFAVDRSSFEALICSGNPRFMLHIGEDYAVKVNGTDGFEDSAVNAAKELYEACDEFKLGKTDIISVMKNLISDPFCFDGKSDKKAKLDKDVEYYLPQLKDLLETGYARIHFKPNSKYDNDDRTAYYIGYSDIYAFLLNIRKKVGDEYDEDNDPVIARYTSPEQLLKDGWRLD